MYEHVHTLYEYVHTLYMQCIYIVPVLRQCGNSWQAGSSLYKSPHVADPSNEIVEVSKILLWGNLDTPCVKHQR